jgi:hypothetical protein
MEAAAMKRHAERKSAITDNSEVCENVAWRTAKMAPDNFTVNAEVSLAARVRGE